MWDTERDRERKKEDYRGWGQVGKRKSVRGEGDREKSIGRGYRVGKDKGNNIAGT